MVIGLFSSCERFSAKVGGTRDHHFSYTVSNGLYNLEYLEALFDNDSETISKFELAAMDDRFGPLASCTTITNYSSIRVNCHECFLFDSECP